MFSNYIKLIIKISISVLFVAYLSFIVNWTHLFLIFKKTDLTYYIVSTVLTFISSIFVACKYYLLIKDTPTKTSLAGLLKIDFISRYYALFLPTAVGPDLVRWYKITKNQSGRTFVFAATIFERLVFVLTILLFGTIPLMLSTEPKIIPLRAKILPLSIACICFALIIIFSFVLENRIKSSLGDFLRKLTPNGTKPYQIIEGFSNFAKIKVNPGVVLPVFILSVIWHVFFLMRLFFLFQATDLSLNVFDAIWIVSIVLFLQVLPVSFAGLGIRESAYAYFLSIFAYPPEKGVLVGILSFSQLLLFSILGGIFELLDNIPNRSRNS